MVLMSYGVAVRRTPHSSSIRTPPNIGEEVRSPPPPVFPVSSLASEPSSTGVPCVVLCFPVSSLALYSYSTLRPP